MKNLLKPILVVGVILTIFLIAIVQSNAAPGVAWSVNTTVVPGITATLPPPTKTPYSLQSTPAGNRPPACTFPLAQTTMEEPTSEEYIFSEPQVSYTPNPYDSDVEIVDWLPDNQQVLIVQNIKGVPQQRIELFNSETGERKVYAIREWTEQHPSWNQEAGAVIYPVRHALATVNHIPKITRQVWVSYGNPDAAQMLADNLPQFAVAVNPGNGHIVYFSSTQISRKNDAMQNMASVSFDLELWNYRNMKSGIFPLMYDMTWRPGSSQVFLYTFANGKPGYTFLLDVDSGEICELNLGGWAVMARWSPNGRYLAIERSQVGGRPVGSTILVVLDTATGNTHSSEVVPQEYVGIRAIRGLAWAPDNLHLLVLGSALSFPHCAPNCYDDTRLYLVDFLSEKVEPILPKHQFIPNMDGSNLAWSPDGSKVVALCPALCSISVQVNEQ